MRSSSRRIVFVDCARALAIALALFSHAMIDVSAWRLDHVASFPLRLWTRSAAPLFIIMFGMMLELVYVRRARTESLQKVAAQLIRRSAQCYLAYVCTALAGWVGGLLTFKGTITASLMITDAYFGNVLKWYTFGLLLAIPLLYLRIHFSIWGVMAFAAATWSLASLPWALWVTIPDRLLNVAGVLLGFGGRYGPSVFHGLVFVAVGMLLANGLRRQSGRTVFYSLCGGLLALVGLTFWFLSWELPILNVLHEAVSDTWRQHNHVGYFALGVGLAVITLFALAVSMRKNKPLPAWSQFPLRFGTSSLAAFTVGNVLLNIRPRGIEIDTFPEALLYGLLFLGTTLLVLNLYSTFSLSSLKFRVSAWLPGRLRPSSRGRAHLNEKEEMGPLSPPPNLKPGAYKPE